MASAIETYRARYVSAVDTLYAGDVDSPCSSVEDTPTGIVVMYGSDGSPIGIEVPCFAERYRNLPAIVDVDSVEPFSVCVHE